MDKYYILTFENTHNAINGEAVLKRNEIKAIVMPTPTFITKSCGISLRFTEEELDRVRQLMLEEKIKVKTVIIKDEKGFKEISLI